MFPDDIKYIVNHAEDKYIFVDAPFLPIIENVISDLKTVKGIVVLTDKEHMPSSSIKNLICYEDLIADESEEIVWPEFDENTASSLCYTSGTTGNPKEFFILTDLQFYMLGMHCWECNEFNF